MDSEALYFNGLKTISAIGNKLSVTKGKILIIKLWTVVYRKDLYWAHYYSYYILKENRSSRNIDQYLVVIELLNTSKPVSLISDFLFSIIFDDLCAEVVDGKDFMTSLCQDWHRQAVRRSLRCSKLYRPVCLWSWHNDVIKSIPSTTSAQLGKERILNHRGLRKIN